MSDIELHERYPLSRREDITDAYMRGVEFGRKMGRGTCTMAHEDGNDTLWSCNECDADVYLPTRPKFCWSCGREVVDG